MKSITQISSFAGDFCSRLGFDALGDIEAAGVVVKFLSDPLPYSWECHVTDVSSQYGPGIRYYVNTRTSESQWEHPREVHILDHVSHVLVNAPRTGSKLEPFWNRRQIELQALNNPSLRPIITDQSSDQQNTSREIHVPTFNGFPILNVAAIKAFGIYYGLNDTMQYQCLWLLKLASVCPLPLGWSIKQTEQNQDNLFLNNSEPYVASTSHPNDSFFQCLIAHILHEPSWLIADTISMIPTTANDPVKKPFDWITGSLLTPPKLCPPQTPQDTTVYPIVLRLKQRLIYGTPEVSLTDLIAIENACIPDVAVIAELCPEIPNLLEDISQLKDIDRTTRSRISSLVSMLRKSITEHFTKLRSQLRHVMLTMSNITHLQYGLAICKRLIENSSFDDLVLVTKFLFRISQQLPGPILEWNTMLSETDLSAFLVQLGRILSPGLHLPSTEPPRSLRVLTSHISFETLFPTDDVLFKNLTEFDDDLDDIPVTNLDTGVFEDLSSKYFPASHIVTRGILEQLSITDLVKVEMILEGLIASFNDRYVPPLYIIGLP